MKIEINPGFRRALDLELWRGQTIHSFFGFKPDVKLYGVRD